MVGTLLLCGMLFFGLLAQPGGGATALPLPDPSLAGRKLAVGVFIAPPFLEKDANGRYFGLAYDLWADVARDIGVTYTLQEFDLEGLLEAVRLGTIDVGISALSLTPERETVMDFSQPFYYSGLGIAVPVKSESVALRIIEAIFSEQLLLYVGSLAALLLVVGVLIWVVERRRNPAHFRPGGKGIGDGMWWSAVTMTSVGYGDATPKTLVGRVMGMVWMFASVVLLASFTAGITSSLTLNNLLGRVQGPADLHKVRTGVVADSSGEEELIAGHIGIRRYPSVEEGLAALVAGNLDAFVHDQPILHYYQHKDYTGDVHILPGFFDPQLYGFAFPRGSELRKSVNVALLRRLENTGYRARLFGPYLGKQAVQ
ncbi:Glutamine ABC transporter, periplasmic glutamine-binding protein [Desulfovibrio sp. TomC]|nr:Glutamine ABC transporter, periplasmic glutamine-binding protein [Desulfovibrio sp. TomC]